MPPKDLKPRDEEDPCYIPKKCIATFAGHDKGIKPVDTLWVSVQFSSTDILKAVVVSGGAGLFLN